MAWSPQIAIEEMDRNGVATGIDFPAAFFVLRVDVGARVRVGPLDLGHRSCIGLSASYSAAKE
jgi:hypothetical protein